MADVEGPERRIEGHSRTVATLRPYAIIKELAPTIYANIVGPNVTEERRACLAAKDQEASSPFVEASSMAESGGRSVSAGQQRRPGVPLEVVRPEIGIGAITRCSPTKQ
jgi:hypothetical protein